MGALIDIEKRHAKRAQCLKDWKSVRKPNPTDSESFKEYVKTLKDTQADLLDACFLVDVDVPVLLQTLRDVIKNEEELDRTIQKIFDRQRLDDETAEILNRRKMEEAAEREKEYKKNGKVPDVPGQQRMFEPGDMPAAAEAAGPVITYKLGQTPPTIETAK